MGEPREILSEDAYVGRSAQERAEHRIKAPKSNAQIIKEAIEWLPGRYNLNNGIVGEYEISKTDIHNLVYEISKELKWDKEHIITNLREIIEKGDYVGWAEKDPGKHPGVAYFAYFSKDIGKRVYLAMKYLSSPRIYKPYAVYSESVFKEDREGTIKKGVPTI